MTLKQSLTILGTFLVSQIKQEIRSQGIDATGDLSDSVKYLIRENVFGLSLEIRYLDYGIYVNDGRKSGGKRIPIDALRNWIKNKGLSNGFKKDTSFAFAIQTNAFKFGIKPKPFKDNVLKKNASNILRMVKKAIKDQMEVTIKDIARDTQRDLNAIR